MLAVHSLWNSIGKNMFPFSFFQKREFSRRSIIIIPLFVVCLNRSWSSLMCAWGPHQKPPVDSPGVELYPPDVPTMKTESFTSSSGAAAGFYFESFKNTLVPSWKALRADYSSPPWMYIYTSSRPDKCCNHKGYENRGGENALRLLPAHSVWKALWKASFHNIARASLASS